MKNKTWFFGFAILLFTLPLSAHAKTFALACPDIATCAQSVSALNNDQYIFVDEPKCGKLHGTSDLELTAENATFIFTNALSLCDYTRVPLSPKLFSIRRGNEARGMALPKFHASSTEDPPLPETADLATLLYQANHPESVRKIADMVRGYADPSARIEYDVDAGLVMVTDRSNNLKSLLTIFRKTDVKKSAETLKQEKENTMLRNKSTSGHS